VALYDELNSLEDLQGLIDSDERESDILEYKTARKRLESKDRDEAAKDVSAFANASGGVLIYGIATDAKDKTKPVALDAIDPLNVNYFLHTIPSAIRQPIAGIRHKTIPVGDTPQAILLDVPQSPSAPHQVAGECRYYRRQGVESVPMSHDLVELYFGRRMQAKLEPIVLSYAEPENPDPSHVQCRVNLGLLNAGGQIGRDVFIRIVEISNRASSLNPKHVPVQTRSSSNDKSKEGRLFAYQHWDELYYPRVARSVIRFSFIVNERTVGPDQPVLFLDVYAADSRPYRYSLFRTFKDGDWTLDWQELGLPSVGI
jgi:hypothetical protein